ncbi:MAG: response regulator [Candidatus Omnitrophica bacterium]|nr:response regulator [Candidatus Omnitrophota bacterium]MDD5430415.1 response regulator [Candidatus Omnitrophota bacterium]
MSKVLVIDDEVEVVDFLFNFLRRFKIQVEKAVSGKGALEAFMKVKPDWVFLDIKMPDIDGFEVLKAIKSMSPEVNVIMITGKEDKESQDKARKLGAFDYIIKPLDLEQLHKKIQVNILDKNN